MEYLERKFFAHKPGDLGNCQGNFESFRSKRVETLIFRFWVLQLLPEYCGMFYLRWNFCSMALLLRLTYRTLRLMKWAKRRVIDSISTCRCFYFGFSQLIAALFSSVDLQAFFQILLRQFCPRVISISTEMKLLLELAGSAKYLDSRATHLE